MKLTQTASKNNYHEKNEFNIAIYCVYGNCHISNCHIYISNDKAPNNPPPPEAKKTAFERVNEEDIKSIYYKFNEKGLKGIKIRATHSGTGKTRLSLSQYSQ